MNLKNIDYLAHYSEVVNNLNREFRYFIDFSLPDAVLHELSSVLKNRTRKTEYMALLHPGNPKLPYFCQNFAG